MQGKILLTFDYELFLGARSGTVENCLIRPTNMLLEILAKHNQQAIFFVDTTYLYRMEEMVVGHQAIFEDLDRIYAQLLQIVKRGHKLYHHLHPHWLDAVYIDSENQWDLSNTRKYRLQDITKEEKEQLYSYSLSFMQRVYKTAGKEYEALGFRAGGLCIDSLAEERLFFEKYGIVADYSNVKPIEEKIQHCIVDGVDEYPISKIHISGLWRLLHSLSYRMCKRDVLFSQFGDGKSSVRPKQSNQKTKLFSFSLPISVELLTPILVYYYKRLYKKYGYIHFLSHPKLQSKGTILLLDSFLSMVSR
ncbi:MAG: hypothetical protein MJ197_01975 [Bacteroidales bacterium]|nr:hypothetical protein [Bacteroidales bacterium]